MAKPARGGRPDRTRMYCQNLTLRTRSKKLTVSDTRRNPSRYFQLPVSRPTVKYWNGQARTQFRRAWMPRSRLASRLPQAGDQTGCIAQNARIRANRRVEAPSRGPCIHLERNTSSADTNRPLSPSRRKVFPQGFPIVCCPSLGQVLRLAYREPRMIKNNFRV